MPDEKAANVANAMSRITPYLPARDGDADRTRTQVCWREASVTIAGRG